MLKVRVVSPRPTKAMRCESTLLLKKVSPNSPRPTKAMRCVVLIFEVIERTPMGRFSKNRTPQYFHIFFPKLAIFVLYERFLATFPINNQRHHISAISSPNHSTDVLSGSAK